MNGHYITAILELTIRLINRTAFCRLFCLLALLPASLIASPKKEIDRPAYSFEFLTFKTPFEDRVRLEIWGEIPAQNLRFDRAKSGFQATYQVSAVLVSSARQEVGRSTVVDTLIVNSIGEPTNRKVGIIKLSYILSPGDYSAVIRVTDLQSSGSSRFRKEFKIPRYADGVFSVSDIQLSPSIVRTEQKSQWTRNSWRIVPNPSRYFNEENRSIFVYAELYNLEFAASEMEKGVLSTFTIRDRNNQAVSSLDIPNIKVSGQSTLVAQIPIRQLMSGQYRLVVTIRDLATGLEVEKSALFFVDNYDLIAESR
jgi:hypothetical protein